MDRGTSQLDCYERAFIDDSLSLSELKRKKKKSSSGGVITKKRLVLTSSESDDTVTGIEDQDVSRRKRIVVQSSEDEGLGTGRGGERHYDPQCSACDVKKEDEEEEEGMQLRRRRKRPRCKRKIPMDESEEEEGNVDQNLRRKVSRKKINSIASESDEDIVGESTYAHRNPSSRSSKLRTAKNMRRTRLLERLHKGISSSESELTTDNEEQSVRRSRAGSGVMCSTPDRELDGEQILFPESDGEESDWIESDSEDTGVDTLISTGCVDRVEHDREDLVGRSDLLVDADWTVHLSGMKVFQAFVTSPALCKSTLLDSSSANCPDHHGLYPLIYSAALANEGALRQLLPCTDLELVQNTLIEHCTTLLNIIIEAPLRKIENGRRVVEEDDVASKRCLQTYFSVSKNHFQNALATDGEHSATALSVAVWNRKPQCVNYLLQNCARPETCHNMFSVNLLPSLLHLAVMINENDAEWSDQMGERTRDRCVALLMQLLPDLCNQLEIPDQSGFTPLMRACELGDAGCLRVLLNHGASLSCRDAQKTSPLHLAAVSGWTDCVLELLSNDHPVDCVDSKGWSPLLYAHFQDHQDCVLALMKANPQQLTILSRLLQMNRDAEGWGLTVKVVRSLLVSLAHHETYHAMFNHFVRQNPLILEEKEYGFLKHCMGLLDYKNKLSWIRRKLVILKNYARRGSVAAQPLSLLSVPRSPPEGLPTVVQSKLNPLSPHSCWVQSLAVTFAKEAGICTGPRKEFWCLYCRELASDKENIFTSADNGQLILQPGAIVMQHSLLHNSATHLAAVHHVGMMLALAVFHGDNIPIRLAPPLLKQLLGIPLRHPDDLELVDQTLFHNLTHCEDISALDLVFAEGIQSPSTTELISFPLLDGGCEKSVNSENKDEYVRLVSEFKLEKSISEETKRFCTGFWKVIPQKCLQVFTTNELSLFLSGVPTIDVDDWKEHTEYTHGIPDETIVWFWRLVRSLKEEEKALLLKFATGSPCVPAGGFKNLLGLGGLTMFHIQEMEGVNKIPHASTCFNTLKLSSYSSEQDLRDKTLIAIRFGCEGFEFS
jgi:ankyrin repeat protein